MVEELGPLLLGLHVCLDLLRVKLLSLGPSMAWGQRQQSRDSSTESHFGDTTQK